MSLVAVSLSPELIIERVAPKPRGGDRRRPGPARTHQAMFRHAEPERAATAQEGLVVDAFDAAFFIGVHCIFWNAVQVLSQPEVARMAFEEATHRIEARRAALSKTWWLTGSGRKAHAEIEADLAELAHASRIIAEAHDAGVIAAA